MCGREEEKRAGILPLAAAWINTRDAVVSDARESPLFEEGRPTQRDLCDLGKYSPAEPGTRSRAPVVLL